MAQEYTRLEIYKQAYTFAMEIYRITSLFPKEEQYGITSQLRRAASSIGANIAEGCGRKTAKDFSHFLYISMGSLKEAEHFMCISKDIGYLKETEYYRLSGNLQILGKMLTKFIQKVKTSC